MAKYDPQKPRKLTIRTGVVVSDKMDKTRIVAVTRVKLISKYHRVTNRTRCFYAHDERNLSHFGDTVKIMLTIPISKKKRWELLSVERVLYSNIDPSSKKEEKTKGKTPRTN